MIKHKGMTELVNNKVLRNAGIKFGNPERQTEGRDK